MALWLPLDLNPLTVSGMTDLIVSRFPMTGGRGLEWPRGSEPFVRAWLDADTGNIALAEAIGDFQESGSVSATIWVEAISRTVPIPVVSRPYKAEGFTGYGEEGRLVSEVFPEVAAEMAGFLRIGI